MPNPRHAPLTADQRALASDPRHLDLARAIAGRYARVYPCHAEEFRPEAWLALCQAARTFDPSLRVSFRTHATCRVRGAMLDVLRRSSPLSYRGRGRGGAPRIGSLSRRVSGGDGEPASTLAATIPAGELPVGWEAEYQDELRQVTGPLPPAHRELIRRLFGHAAHATLRKAGRGFGVSEARLWAIHDEAIGMLRRESCRPRR